jgi:hypothetical protein
MALLGTMMSVQSGSTKTTPIKRKIQKVKYGSNLKPKNPNSRRRKPLWEKNV